MKMYQIIQANSPILLINLLKLWHSRGLKCEQTNISTRQVQYYLAAAKILGLISEDHNLTHEAHEIINSPPNKQVALLLVLFLESEFIKHLTELYGWKEISNFSISEIENQLENILYLSSKTKKRRLSALKSWIHFFQKHDLEFDLNHLNQLHTNTIENNFSMKEEKTSTQNERLTEMNKEFDSEEEFEEESEEEGGVEEEEGIHIGRKILFDRAERRISDLERDYKDGVLDINPNFQRKYVWDLKRSSLFIESIMLNVPIPLIYTSEEREGDKEVVIDGQQRLSSVFNFLNNDYSLQGLKSFSELNGKYYKHLDENYKTQIKRYTLSVVKISKDSDDEVKFEIFERINSGSVNLTAQELRNCVYRGKYNDFLKEYAENNNLLLNLFFGNKKPKRMQHVEMLLRFFSFYMDMHNYKGKLKNFLNNHMKKQERVFSQMDEKEFEEETSKLKKKFKDAMDVAFSVFGKHAFENCALKDKKLAWSGKKTKAIFEFILVGFASFERNQLMPHLDAIKEAFIAMMLEDEKYDLNDAIYGVEKTKYRFRNWSSELQNIVQYSNEPRTFSQALKNELYSQSSVCKLCNQNISSVDDAEIDHVQPYWKGGATIPENAQLVHRFCNRKKSGNDMVGKKENN